LVCQDCVGNSLNRLRRVSQHQLHRFWKCGRPRLEEQHQLGT
jgi:hypothetical protein